MPLSSTQKAAVSQFVAITGAPDKTAQRYLKNASYQVNNAVDAYFASNGGGSNAAAAREGSLKTMFEALRKADDSDDDKIGVDGAMEYLQNLGINLEDASLFVALEVVQAEAIGELNKSGFVEGWKIAGVDGNVPAQKNYIQNQIARLSTDVELFKKVYRYAFVVGKEPSVRALSLDNAIVYWEMLFKKPGRQWAGKATGKDWLGLWVGFLRDNWTRSVNRDMWNQTLEFAVKSVDDETLSFWSEDGAWPGVVDDFVAWYHEKHGKSEAMDVDA